MGIDLITNFITGTDDIVLDQTTFAVLTNINSQFTRVTTDLAAAISAAFIVYNSSNGRLFYNQNGAAAGLGTGARFATIDSDNNASTAPPILATTDFIFQA